MLLIFMKMFLGLLFAYTFFRFPVSHAVSPVPQSFPATWNGDHLDHVPCQVVQSPPAWLNGYLFCQLCASYGDQSADKGQKIMHMFDAIGGLAVFDLTPDNNTFTGAYYPTRSYKIWNFYDRNMRESTVAWDTMFTTVNVTNLKMWEPIHTDYGSTAPNVDFWKVGTSIIAGTEYYGVGLTFDVQTVSNFRAYPFKEASPIMHGQPLVPIEMPIHERIDLDSGLMWSTVSALNISAYPPSFHQVVFTVDNTGLRTVQGVFNFAHYDPTKCSPNGTYLGDKRILLPRYMHSITSTKNYLILPMTSSVINPCAVLKGPSPVYPANATLADPVDGWFFDWAPEAPMTFLIFDKRSKQFLTPIEFTRPQFVTHQFNAYEIDQNHILADMIIYDTDAYSSLYVDKLTSSVQKSSQHLVRFNIDLSKSTVSGQLLLPPNQDPTDLEFSQFNHNFEGTQYKYGYAVASPYYAANQIVKIDMDEPSGKNNIVFQPTGNQYISLSEPYFVQAPNTNGEDDGLLIVRGVDTSISKTRVYFLNAKTLDKEGEIVVDTVLPFGFHQRYYTKESLGFPSSIGLRNGSTIVILLGLFVSYFVHIQE